MAQLTDEELAAVEARGKRMLDTEPRARTARFDAGSGRIVVELVNGCLYAFPTHLVEDLKDAEKADLAQVTVDSVGFNLHWPTLDVDLNVPALVAGIFGTRKWMVAELAGIAGRVRSPAKTAAARANGRKGGRPRKAAQG